MEALGLISSGWKFEDPRHGLPDLLKGPGMVVPLLLSRGVSLAEEKVLR